MRTHYPDRVKLHCSMRKTKTTISWNAGIIFPLILLIALIISCKGKRKATAQPVTYTVSGFVMEKQDYCGGAKPTEDMSNPAPVGKEGIKMYIRKSNVNSSDHTIIDSIVSGPEGTFSVQLPAGEYCFIETWKKGPLVYPQDDANTTWNKECYKKSFETCDLTLQVKENTSGHQIVLHRRCPWRNPCNTYRGPLPPSAPPVNRGGFQPGHQE